MDNTTDDSKLEYKLYNLNLMMLEYVAVKAGLKLEGFTMNEMLVDTGKNIQHIKLKIAYIRELINVLAKPFENEQNIKDLFTILDCNGIISNESEKAVTNLFKSLCSGQF